MKNYYEHYRQMEEFPVAMAYVPWQKLDKIYENLEEAFHEGTIFPELNKPFCGRRCVK
ncbi:MAG: spore coat associated protein CotJA [Lachnospiraceae bacterium]|nr:spore coat associated protein CotJA [Lachnospiraceae bacterium]MBQ8199692.1 spore coat associated protein CotJA [Lachnospiraceae bacterium]